LSVSTGAVLWTFDSHSVLVDRVCGQIGITDFVGNGAAYDGRSQLGLAYHVKVDYSDVTADFDAITGKKIFIREPLQLFDPMTRYAVVYGQDFGAGRTLGIVVYDTATGDTIYSMDVAKAVSLDAAPVGIMDGRLFLKTSDQSLEIDVKSGEVLSESLGAYPVAVAGKYAYFTNGELVPLSQVDSYRPAA
jgi:hypothetical protein